MSRPAWAWEVTLADLDAIEALPEDLRDTVERYARSFGKPAVAEDELDEEYEHGWEDGCEAMEEEYRTAFFSAPNAETEQRRKQRAKDRGKTEAIA